MEYTDIIKWIGTITAVTGQVLINRKNIMAYPVWIFSSLMMIIAMSITKDWAMFTLYVIYIGLNIDGLIKWRKKKGEA